MENTKQVRLQALYRNKFTGSLYATGEVLHIHLHGVWYDMVGYGRFPITEQEDISARLPEDFLENFDFVRLMTEEDVAKMIDGIDFHP